MRTSHILSCSGNSPQNEKSYFQNLNQNWPTLFGNRKLRFVQPSQTILTLLIPYRNTGTTTPESPHPRTTFSHAMRKALFAQLLPYQILHPTHTMFVRTVSLVMRLHPSPIPFDATTTTKSVAGLYEGLFCYLLYEIFVIRKTCSKTPKKQHEHGEETP